MSKTTKKTKPITLNTPLGTARYPWLTAPDTRFNEEGEYAVQLLLPEDAPEVKALVKKLKDVYEEFRATLDDPKKAKKEPETYGFSSDLDDNGDETGYLVFKFKSKTGYTNKKGERVSLTAPALFDAKLKRLPAGTPIWGGTTMFVNFTPSAYFQGKNCGVTLRLNACQIIELVGGDNSSKAGSDFGFNSEEGYSVAPELEENDAMCSSDEDVCDEDF